MNKVIYKNTDLFTAIGNNTILIHTVSVRPKQDTNEYTAKFKELFPVCFNDYLYTSELYKSKRMPNSLLGKSFWFGYPDSKQRVAFFYVSKKFGKWQDGPNFIVRNTETAVRTFLSNLPESIEIHSSKLNSYNFKIPWRATEKIINNILKDYPRHRWYIHDTN